jgi:hypothetical protein
MTELGHGRLAARSRARGARVGLALARSIRWLGPGDGFVVHHPRPSDPTLGSSDPGGEPAPTRLGEDVAGPHGGSTTPFTQFTASE